MLGLAMMINMVLNEFSFKINKGDFVGITGKSGKGKTTILNLLLGFLSPKRGEILINDDPVSSNAIKKLLAYYFLCSATAILIHDSILRNIILEENRISDRKVGACIRNFRIERFYSPITRWT